MTLPWTWLKDIGGNVNVAELYGYGNGCGCEYGNGKGYAQEYMEMGKGMYREHVLNDVCVKVYG